jgi:hypothetical protein
MGPTYDLMQKKALVVLEKARPGVIEGVLSAYGVGMSREQFKWKMLSPLGGSGGGGGSNVGSGSTTHSSTPHGPAPSLPSASASAPALSVPVPLSASASASASASISMSIPSMSIPSMSMSVGAVGAVGEQIPHSTVLKQIGKQIEYQADQPFGNHHTSRYFIYIFIIGVVCSICVVSLYNCVYYCDT